MKSVSDQQPANPWAGAEERYQAGQEVRGVVTRVAQFGVFVQIEPGLEGIVYTFELGTGPGALTGFAPGQEMQLYVKNIDTSRKRLELSPANASTPGLLDKHALPPDLHRTALPGALLTPGLPGERVLPPDLRSKTLPGALLTPGLRSFSSGTDLATCPTCQRQIQAAWKFCVYCGGSLLRRCPACGSTQPDLPDARYCYECGTPI